WPRAVAAGMCSAVSTGPPAEEAADSAPARRASALKSGRGITTAASKSALMSSMPQGDWRTTPADPRSLPDQMQSSAPVETWTWAAERGPRPKYRGRNTTVTSTFPRPRSWSRVSRASARFSGTVPLRAAVSAATRESRRGSLSQVGPRVLLGGEAATGGDRLGSAQPEVGEQRRGGLGERLVAPGPHLHAAVPGMIRGGVHDHLG